MKIIALAIVVLQVCVPFHPSMVRLEESRFKDNFRRDTTWIMSIPVESLVHSFQTSSGAWAGKEGGYMTVEKLGGWESLDCELRGHTTGHMLSALAWIEAATSDGRAKAKADSILSALEAAQKAYGNGYLSAFPEELINRNIRGERVWAPFYTLHKILQGLLDQWTICGSEKALILARGMGDWAYGKLSPLDEDTRKRMICNEFGGFNEAMYNLYAATRDERYLSVARFFYHDEKVDPIKAGETNLGTNHANTFIPKLLGEARNYELFGAEDSRKAAELLFSTLAYEHAFVTGEVSDKEHLFSPEKQSRHLSGYDGENCCTFNLLKLAGHIFCWNADPKVADYYERALYNHILGQQDTLSSMVCYFTPLMTGAYRLLSTRKDSFWCCVGSGFESHARYTSSIYFHSDDALWVNLFIPSILDWDGTMVRQKTDFPNKGAISFSIGGTSRDFTLNIRYPSWAEAVSVKVNGRNVKVSQANCSYIAIRRYWKAGDKVEVEFPMTFHQESTRDDPSRYAILRGPIVMAGKLCSVNEPFSDPSAYNDYYTYDYAVPEGLSHVKYSKDIPLIPFYDAQRCRYVVYWDR